MDDCENIELESNTDIIVSKFIEAMTETYKEEWGRRDNFRQLAREYLDIELILASVSISGKEYPTDGCMIQDNHLIVVLEVKNDNAGNTFACGYYWKWIQNLPEDYARKIRLPCLLLCLTG